MPGLAPMEGVTNFPMRLWFWLASAPQSMATPFLRATPTYPTKELPDSFAPELFQLKQVTPYQLIPQIMTAEAADFVRTALLFEQSYTHIELNAGCPSPNCVGKGAGSSLLAQPQYFASMIETIAKVLGPSVFAVKMRTGFHSSNEFPQLIDAINGIDICRLTIHGRTRPQGYKGQADWDLIEQAATTLSIPVFASGDIGDSAMLKQKQRKYPHIAGAIIGRGALRNPWIFEQIRNDEALNIDRTTVVHALAVFGILQDLYLTNLPLLISLAKDGLFTTPCFRAGQSWKQIYDVLAKETFGSICSPFDAAFPSRFLVDRKTAGRMKLIWNYLRSSLPESFFMPQVLRSSSPGALLQAIDALFTNDSPVPLCYNSDHNWIFNGEKNERQAALQKQAAAQDQNLVLG